MKNILKIFLFWNLSHNSHVHVGCKSKGNIDIDNVSRNNDSTPEADF